MAACDDEVRERAVDLGAPELARDAPLPGRRPLTGPQAHSVLRLKRGRPSGWAAARLRSGELLIGSFAGSLRRRELDRVPRWRGDHVTVKQVVDDFAWYLYPPRLQAHEVLHRAVADGAGLRTRSGCGEKPRKPRICWGNRRSVRVRTGQTRLPERETAGSTAGSGEPCRTSDVVQPSLRGGDAGRRAVSATSMRARALDDSAPAEREILVGSANSGRPPLPCVRAAPAHPSASGAQVPPVSGGAPTGESSRRHLSLKPRWGRIRADCVNRGSPPPGAGPPPLAGFLGGYPADRRRIEGRGRASRYAAFAMAACARRAWPAGTRRRSTSGREPRLLRRTRPDRRG